MHTIQKDSRYYVLNQDETWTTYESHDDLMYWLYINDKRGVWGGRDWRARLFEDEGRLLKEIGHTLNDTYYDWVDNLLATKKFPVKYVVYGAGHRVVSKKFLKDSLDIFDYDAYSKKKWRNRGYKQWLWDCHRPSFRRDPVPGTGGNRWSFSHYYRTKIHCTQEKRASEVARQEGFRVRGRRTKRYLPDPWDDIRRGNSYDKKSWKKVRKRKQWMRPGIVSQQRQCRITEHWL
ncbi:MAG: hypothetical protein DRI65_11350 [Chloroflexota bacterium]|nr:MAG: hypothetical protein DRI65_11350 [Chloroflexota bacterium]